MSNKIQVHIEPKQIIEGDTGPQIIIGFSHPSFSQAIYMDAPFEPADAMLLADQVHEGILRAAGAAVSVWKNQENKTAE